MSFIDDGQAWLEELTLSDGHYDGHENVGDFDPVSNQLMGLQETVIETVPFDIFRFIANEAEKHFWTESVTIPTDEQRSLSGRFRVDRNY